MKTTEYFLASVMARRPYLKDEWIEYVLSHPVHRKVQENGRIRQWAFIPVLGKYLPVVTEPDGETVHNAFPDFQYYPTTDMLYIKLADKVSAESEEVAPGIVLDFGEQDQVVGIEIEDASTFIDLSRLEVAALPLASLVFSQRVPEPAS